MADIAGMIGGSFSGWGAGIGQVGIMVLWLVLIFLCCYAVWFLLSFSIDIVIKERNGSSNIETRDKGKKVRDKKDKKIWELRLLKNKNDWRGPIHQRFIVPTKKAFGRLGWKIYFLRNDDGSLHPIAPPTVVGNDWDSMGPADLKWAIIALQEGAAVYSKPDWMSKYGAVLVPIFGFIVVGVIMIVMFQQMEPLAQAFQTASNAYAEAIKSQLAVQVVS